MNIFSVRDRFYAKVNGRFSLRTLETALDAKLHMRSGSFAEQYCKGIFLAIFQDAVDLRQEYLSYYAEEYDDFDFFLYQKKLWERADIRSLNLAENEILMELYPDYRSYNLTELLTTDSGGIKMLNDTLEDMLSVPIGTLSSDDAMGMLFRIASP